MKADCDDWGFMNIICKKVLFSTFNTYCIYYISILFNPLNTIRKFQDIEISVFLVSMGRSSTIVSFVTEPDENYLNLTRLTKLGIMRKSPWSLITFFLF